MAGLMAGVAIMLIISAVAFQAWADMLRRDNEAEMIFRAQDIVRAIQRYRRDHGGAGPDTLERLMEAGPKGQYYLRQLYEDPLVPDGKWGLLYAGPGGGVIDPNAVGQSGMESGFGSNSGFGMQNSQMSKGKGKGKGGFGGMQQSGMNQGGAAGQGQIGGMLIAGVRTLCDEKPFRLHNGLTEYSEWMFTYLELENQRQQRKGQPSQGIEAPTSAFSNDRGSGFGSGPPSRRGNQ
jgi:type II secretory pathway pseudopilin PulG